MTINIGQRPGVYSSYDTSSVVSRSSGGKAVGLAAVSSSGTKGQAYTVASYQSALTIFGQDSAEAHMLDLCRLIFLNGAATIIAVPAAVATEAESADYEAAFKVLETADCGVICCDSSDTAVLQAMRDSADSASAARRERIAICGGASDDASALATAAQALNSERCCLVSPAPLDASGTTLPGYYLAAAAAGAVASQTDPALPLSGARVYGFGGLAHDYSDSEIDTLILGGVTPFEALSGEISFVRAVSTRTKTSGTTDYSWRELSTVMIADDVLSSLRSSLRSRFARSKNTAQTRSAVKSQVIVELEAKKSAQIIDGYGEISVTQNASDPERCDVEFEFAVAHGLNQIVLEAHISI